MQRVYAPSLFIKHKKWTATTHNFFYDGQRHYFEADQVEAVEGKKRVRAKSMSGTSTELFFKEANFTTCNRSHSHYSFSAERLSLSEEKIQLKNVRLSLFGLRFPRIHSLTRKKGSESQNRMFMPSLALDREDLFQLTLTSDYTLRALHGEAHLLFTPKNWPNFSLSSQKEKGWTYFIGETREKNRFYKNTTIRGAWLRYQFPHLSFLVEGGGLRESISAQKRTYLALRFQSPIASFQPFLFEVSGQSFLYHAAAPYSTFSPKVSYTTPSFQAWFTPSWVKNRAAFTIHQLNAQTEIGLSKKVKYRSIAFGMRLRYDNQSKQFQEIKGTWTKTYDCMSWSLSYEQRGKHLHFSLSFLDF